jgi:lipopolysaccharide export system protein LptA
MKIHSKNPGYALRLLALLLAPALQAQMTGVEISAFRVPEYDSKGTMTSQLFGDHAVIGDDGEVNITGLTIEFYKDSKTVMKVTSPYCFYNQKTKEAHSDAPVAGEMDQMRVSGQGYLLKPGANTVRILNQSQVTIEGAMQKGKGTAAVSGSREKTSAIPVPGMSALTADRGSNDVTVITSKELFFNYKSRNVRFEQDVHVKDVKMTMDCGTLDVRFSEKNEINWIEALTNVKIVSEGREANAGKAVYDVASDEFMLQDNPSFRDGKNTLFGDRIRFWRSTGRMVCEPQARLVIFPDKNVKTDFFEK